MERERWKVRMCVIIVTVVAIIVGCVYYLQCLRPVELTEGMLISIMKDVGEGMYYNDIK